MSEPAAVPVEVDEPTLLRTPPPLRRDASVAIWVAASTVSWLGDTVWTVALAFTAAHTLPPAVAGVVLGIELLPQAALVLLGGVIADRLDTRKVLVAGEVALAVVLLLGAAAWQAGVRGAALLIVLSLSFGIARGLTIPAGSTLPRQLVRGEDLGTISGWTQIAGRGARLLGAPLGGVLVAWSGLPAAMLLDATSFLLVAVVLVTVVRPRYRMPRVTGERWTASLRGGLRYLRRDRPARLLAVGVTALNVFVTPVVALGVALRVTGSHWGSPWLGFADGALAAGAILGSVAAIRWRPVAVARAGFVTLVVQGGALAAVGLPARATLLGAMFLVGVTAGMASVWLSGVFQRTVAASHLGRVSSVTSLGDMSLVPLAVPVLGALAAATSVVTATVLFGVAMALLCGWFASLRSMAALR